MFTFILLVDHKPPVITGCDSGVDLRKTEATETGSTKATPYKDGSYLYSWTFPAATDPSNAFVYSQNRKARDYVFYPGKTTVSIVYSDTYGNQAPCIFEVIVRKSFRGALEIFNIIHNFFPKYLF